MCLLIALSPETSFPSVDSNPRRALSSLTLTCSGTSFHPMRYNHSSNHLFILLIIIILTSTQMVRGIIETVHPLSK